MFLSENTAEAQQLRLSLYNLLNNDHTSNVGLGLELLKSGGFHLSMFPYIWLLYRARREKHTIYREKIEQIYQDFFPRFFTPNAQTFLQKHLENNSVYWNHDKYKLFEKVDFFELLLTEEIYDWDSLLALWQADIFFTAHTCLTRFFLENLEKMDARFFLHPHLKPSQMHISQMATVFAREDKKLNKLAFLKKFKVGNTLDLSNTGLPQMPAEVLQIPAIEVVNLIGTNIKELPIKLLKRIQDVQANKKSMRHILKQVYLLNEYDYPFAQKVAFRKARINFEGKKYAAAYSLLQIAAQQKQDRKLLEKDRKEFWEMYFTCAILEKDFAQAKKILPMACLALPNQYAHSPLIFNWKIWLDFLPEILYRAEEDEWFALIEPYCTAHKPQEGFQLQHARTWQLFSERWIYKNRVDEALALFEKSKKYTERKEEQWASWVRIFRFLQTQKSYSTIVRVFEHYEKIVFYMDNKPNLPLSRHFRCVYIWLEAYFQLNDLARVELFCAEYIAFFQSATHVKTGSKILATFGKDTIFYWVYCAYINLFYIYTRQGNTTCAQFYLQKAIKIYPQNEEALQKVADNFKELISKN
jgi:tetratricopeptide (TPR) repeat protein